MAVDIQEKGDTTIAGDPTLSGSATDVLAAIVTAETTANFTVPNNHPDRYTGDTIQVDQVADIQEKGDTTTAGDPTLSGSATDVLAAIVTAETKRTSLVPNNHPDWYTGDTIQADEALISRRRRYHNCWRSTLSGSAPMC